MNLNIEIDRFDERVFVRFKFRKIAAGVLMFHPQEWALFENALKQTFELEVDTVDHQKHDNTDDKGEHDGKN